MIRSLASALLFSVAVTAQGQIQVDLKFKRLQYIAYEPVLATVTITNLAGRDVELHDGEQPWFGFEVTAREGRTLVPLPHPPEPPLRLAAGAAVTRKINLTLLFPIADLGVYHVRANVYFADLNKFFYARAKAFEITSARPIWRQTVGAPASHGARTYSLMTNRFPDHTSLYVRVEDKENSLVYATYSLGRVISFDEPHAEVDRKNRLHVLQCSAPRIWSYSVIDLDGRLLKHANYAQTRSSPRLRRAADGTVAVAGGTLDAPPGAASQSKGVPKLSDRPVNRSPGN
jgi:hypothetical protein